MIACPLPRPAGHVQLAHGGGGKLMHDLVESIFLPAFGARSADVLHDAATLPRPPGRIAVTTDSFVVSPLFFPGGDIGSLAVYGTVNDLAMSGARPLHLTAAFILEEGLPLEVLERVAASMGRAAAECGVTIVAGDTKVVDRGKGDGLFVTTTGVGAAPEGIEIGPAHVRTGDVIVVSGDLGRHGIAILATREGLSLESTIESDGAPLYRPVARLLEEGIGVHCLRDLTRGGLAAALNEIGAAAGRSLEVSERAIPVRPDVRAACELLGLDPLYVANEGAFVAFLASHDADRALALLRREFPERAAAIAGVVRDAADFTVVLKSVLGTRRVLDMPLGEQLPRIC